MKTRSIISAALFACLLVPAFSPLAAAADSCAKKASALARKQKAELLSAKSEDGKCVVKMRIAGADGKPPRIVEKTVEE